MATRVYKDKLMTEPITQVNEVMDIDDAVALFEINKTSEGQNEPFRIVMNSWGNPELEEVYAWYAANNRQPPPLSGYPIEPIEP